ncbi:MAG: glycosyltransferase [Planctomycetota bacterium]|nr:glycosyltransferase [Planctomycetota bacterium]
MTVSVIIVTLNRPDCVRRCLNCLLEQQPAADQLIVVDASADDLTEKVTAEFPGVIYLRNVKGYGRMTASRNIGLKQASGELIAFVDDDAFARPGWLKNLLASYADPKVGAVGGRACNGVAGEEAVGVNEIGQLRRNGTLTGNFGADPKRIIEVDHVMGCNMSYRRAVIAQLGGFREDYPGISGVREDSDMCVRVKKLGLGVLFNPAAIVDHIGAPQAVGKRFDARYEFYIQRNHMTLLVRNFGLTSSKLWRYLGFNAINAIFEFVRRCGGAVVRLAAVIAGTLVGAVAGMRLLASTGQNPARVDPDGEAIRAALGGRADRAGNAGPMAMAPGKMNEGKVAV